MSLDMNVVRSSVGPASVGSAYPLSAFSKLSIDKSETPPRVTPTSHPAFCAPHAPPVMPHTPRPSCPTCPAIASHASRRHISHAPPIASHASCRRIPHAPPVACTRPTVTSQTPRLLCPTRPTITSHTYQVPHSQGQVLDPLPAHPSCTEAQSKLEHLK